MVVHKLNIRKIFVKIMFESVVGLPIGKDIKHS